MHFILAIEDEYTGPQLLDGRVTLEFMEHLMKTYREQGKLHRKYAYKILLDVKQLFMSQPSLVEITIPDDSKFTVCGDIHGQFYDLMNIFELNGMPSTKNPYVSFYASWYSVCILLTKCVYKFQICMITASQKHKKISSWFYGTYLR